MKAENLAEELARMRRHIKANYIIAAANREVLLEITKAFIHNHPARETGLRCLEIIGRAAMRESSVCPG